MIKRMVMALICIKMGRNLLASGTRTSNTALVMRHNLMATDSKAITNFAKRMDWAHLNGMMDKYLSENFKTTISRVQELIAGLTAGNTKAIGK